MLFNGYMATVLLTWLRLCHDIATRFVLGGKTSLDGGYRSTDHGSRPFWERKTDTSVPSTGGEHDTAGWVGSSLLHCVEKVR